MFYTVQPFLSIEDLKRMDLYYLLNPYFWIGGQKQGSILKWENASL
jgi:hypothetical protein